MKEINDREKTIIKFLLEKIKNSQDIVEIEIYNRDLIEFVIQNGVNDNKEFLSFIKKDFNNIFNTVKNYNQSISPETFEQALVNIFRKEKYQDYEIENTELKENLKLDLEKIKKEFGIQKISDECIAKLIHSMKARVINDDYQKEKLNNYHWAPEALIAQELLCIILPEKLELYYISASENNEFYSSLVNAKIIEQRKNNDWILENEQFIREKKLEQFFMNERNILTDLLDFLPELENVKFGVSINFPISSLCKRLELILYYFEKSEISVDRKEFALQILNAFYKKFILNTTNTGMHFDNCLKLLNLIKKNIDDSKLEEEKLIKKARINGNESLTKILENQKTTSIKSKNALKKQRRRENANK